MKAVAVFLVIAAVGTLPTRAEPGTLKELTRFCGATKCPLYPTNRCKDCVWRCLNRRYLTATADITTCLGMARMDACMADVETCATNCNFSTIADRVRCSGCNFEKTVFKVRNGPKCLHNGPNRCLGAVDKISLTGGGGSVSGQICGVVCVFARAQRGTRLNAIG